jgi:hypothetical protein
LAGPKSRAGKGLITGEPSGIGNEIQRRSFYERAQKEDDMARKYSKAASDKVEKAMHERKEGTLKSGRGGKVKSRKQAIAIGLSEARAEGKKVPDKKAVGKKKG